MRIRAPVVAGAFYPADRGALKRSILECLAYESEPGTDATYAGKVFGAICPHAGYVYSGHVACRALRAVASQSPDLYIMAGPNHSGIGGGMAVTGCSAWRTPLGDVVVDSEAASEVARASGIRTDDMPHAKEHSIEVMLPMLQHMARGFKIVPISLADQSIDAAITAGSAMADMAAGKSAAIIGSSDFTHYEPDDRARAKDAALIEPILRLDVNRFYHVLEELDVSACGYGAVAATMEACRRLGATCGRLLKYATSGDVTGDLSSVVGYGAIVFT